MSALKHLLSRKNSFTKSSFLTGMGSAVGLSGNFYRVKISDDDLQSVGRDWRNVGSLFSSWGKALH